MKKIALLGAFSLRDRDLSVLADDAGIRREPAAAL